MVTIVLSKRRKRNDTNAFPGQITINGFLHMLAEDAEANDPAVGEYVKQWGQNICHIMRPGYVGQKVVYDCSTQSHKWMRVGILEEYFQHEDTFRSVIYVGKKQRILLDHRNGRTIYEVNRRVK